MRRLSVIIPAYSNAAAVLTCLNSLQALSRHPVQYHVQDDASPDMTYAPIISARVASTARNADNLGFAGNCNAGAQHAIGDVLLFVNQDISAVYGWSEGWDETLSAAFDDERVGIVGPRLLFPNGYLQSAGGAFDQAAQPVHRCLGWSDVKHASIGEPADVPWVTGAVLAIRRELFDALGGFDTAYRMYFEDVDLCLRAGERGAIVRYWPACTLIHPAGSTGGSPYFGASARTFKARWVDSGKITPGSLIPTVRYW